MQVTIGGNRLGSGNKMTADLRTYERSTHDLSRKWRSSMSAGTLVPFLVLPTLPNDRINIELQCEVLTHPTEGPLFGSYKVQLDVFEAPVRLYQSGLHNNKLNIGRFMEEVMLPQVELQAWAGKPATDNSQIEPSCIFHYLGISGIGAPTAINSEVFLTRKFNAIPWLAYLDIYKNYYANKQEEIGYVIHTELNDIHKTVTEVQVYNDSTPTDIPQAPAYTPTELTDTFQVGYTGANPGAENILLTGSTIHNALVPNRTQTLLNTFINVDYSTPGLIACTGLKNQMVNVGAWDYAGGVIPTPPKPVQLEQFDLDDIDVMRENILKANWNEQYTIQYGTLDGVFNLPLNATTDGQTNLTQSQEGLCVKTYQSDLFNNWISTEWIDGDNGINAITAVDTSSGEFTIDQLQLAKKVYDMLNRVAMSDGTYKSWIEVNYDNEGYWMTETPIYCGSLIKELVFQEVISNSTATVDGQTQPLGQLAGRGVLSQLKHKGGRMEIKTKEHGYIMGIVSITPRIDYFQGNQWFTHIQNMNEWHKPALDQIGFQDLITEQMAYWDTSINISDQSQITQHSAGKQPAWINYMTAYNEIHGNFAKPDNEGFMVLTRRYENNESTGNTPKIADLTTYIDPAKYNFIFAETSLDSQNFWVNIGIDIEARRKMSAKIMPNL